MSIGERIRKIRKDFNKSQEDFGKVAKIGKTSVSKLEKGENNPSDQTIELICKGFDVNEEWLRYGTGEPYAEISENDRYFKNVAKLQRADDETIMRWVNAIAETSPESLKEIEDFMKKLLGIEK